MFHIHLGKLSEAQDERDRYPHAMAGYIAWLWAQWAHFSAVLPEDWRELRTQARREGQHWRLQVLRLSRQAVEKITGGSLEKVGPLGPQPCPHCPHRPLRFDFLPRPRILELLAGSPI
ncbi:MAG: hypothetical protein ACM3S0_08350 [Acidobacteriota bacterium]